MKALVLAAGFGTRLLPHTRRLPKPLFPINGRPVLETALEELIRAGVDGIIVNTHHLHDQIAAYIASRTYPVPVTARHEATILGTGGAIRNVADFLGNEPFLVVNSDILTSIDFQAVMSYHQRHPHPATLVMHHYPEFNKVRVTEDAFIQGFDGCESESEESSGPSHCLAFTGIHALDPSIMEWIPENRFVSIIDVYRRLIQTGRHLKAYVENRLKWRDMGAPEHFFEAACDASTPIAFEKAFGFSPQVPITRTRLSGDGSDRRWFRMGANGQTLILADHGIRVPDPDHPAEVDAFVRIGGHLRRQGVPVPEMYHADPFSGLVFLEDLGDTHLQTVVQGETDNEKIIMLYRKVIDHLVRMSVEGGDSFDPAWTWQTPSYDRELILERECRYFVESLLNGYLGMDTAFDDLLPAFTRIADQALEHGVMGFMHRDFQSRNIMVKGSDVYFIDFQGGRTGPLQYDLASLLTDPYVALSPKIQTILLDDTITRLSRIKKIHRQPFVTSYDACAVARILQSLGAFGHLTRVKHKPFFEPFIPVALANLERRLAQMPDRALTPLTTTVKNARNVFHLKRKASP